MNTKALFASAAMVTLLAASSALAAPTNDTALNAKAKACAQSWQAMKPSGNRDRTHRDFYKTCMGISGPVVPDVPDPTYTNPKRSAPRVTTTTPYKPVGSADLTAVREGSPVKWTWWTKAASVFSV